MNMQTREERKPSACHQCYKQRFLELELHISTHQSSCTWNCITEEFIEIIKKESTNKSKHIKIDYDWINKYLKGTYVIILVNQRQKSCSVNQMRRMISEFG